MKRIEIVNTMEKYYDYKRQVRNELANYQGYEAFEDDWGMRESKKKIEKINEKLGKYLDMEI